VAEIDIAECVCDVICSNRQPGAENCAMLLLFISVANPIPEVRDYWSAWDSHSIALLIFVGASSLAESFLVSTVYRFSIRSRMNRIGV
jgi:hypothetical protein